MYIRCNYGFSSLLLALCWISLTESFLSAGKGVLRYLVPKWLSFPKQCGEWLSLPA